MLSQNGCCNNTTSNGSLKKGQQWSCYSSVMSFTLYGVVANQAPSTRTVHEKNELVWGMGVVSVTSVQTLNRRNHLTCWFGHRRHLFRCLAAGSLLWWNWSMLILMGWALLLLKTWSPEQHFARWEKNDWFSLEEQLPSHNRLFLLLLLILTGVSLARLQIFLTVTCSLRNGGANKTTCSNFTTNFKEMYWIQHGSLYGCKFWISHLTVGFSAGSCSACVSGSLSVPFVLCSSSWSSNNLWTTSC